MTVRRPDISPQSVSWPVRGVTRRTCLEFAMPPGQILGYTTREGTLIVDPRLIVPLTLRSARMLRLQEN